MNEREEETQDDTGVLLAYPHGQRGRGAHDQQAREGHGVR